MIGLLSLANPGSRRVYSVPFGVPLTETFLPENLKAAGYHTALFGKWCARPSASADRP